MSRILYFQSGSQASMLAFSEACLALSPKLSLHEGRELFIDVAPTLKLFGGEAALLITVEELVESFELDCRRLLTDRPEWARMLCERREKVFPAGRSAEWVRALPIERLVACGDPAEADAEAGSRTELVRFMRRVGLRTVEDFVALPPMAVGRRFGTSGLRLRAWALGERELHLPPFAPEEAIAETVPTDDLPSLDAVLFVLRGCLVRLEARLVGRSRLATGLTLHFTLASRATKTLALELTEPLRDASALLRLLRERLSGTASPLLEEPSPLQSLTVIVSGTTSVTPAQLSLFDQGENRYGDLAEYIGRLRARYGDDAVGFPVLRESYLPERSWENIWPPEPTPRSAPPSELPARPPFLLTPARALTPSPLWRLTPSENLAVEWWDESGGERRYFIAEMPQGERLWIYWDGRRESWFLHGTFD